MIGMQNVFHYNLEIGLDICLNVQLHLLLLIMIQHLCLYQSFIFALILYMYKQTKFPCGELYLTYLHTGKQCGPCLLFVTVDCHSHCAHHPGLGHVYKV